MFHCPFELNGVCSNVYCSFQHLSLTSDAPKLLPRELLPLPPLALPNINASNHTTDADLDNKNQNGELISGMDHIGDGTVVREEAMKDDGSMSEVGGVQHQEHQQKPAWKQDARRKRVSKSLKMANQSNVCGSLDKYQSTQEAWKYLED
jgi:hypothetical protein